MGPLLGYGLQRHLIRQGLDLLYDTTVSESYSNAVGGSPNGEPHICVSPDKSRILLAGGTNAANYFFIYPDSNDFKSPAKPIATFGGAVYAGSASNTYFAVGGTSPFLYVFDYATLSLQTVSTTGLGNVWSLDFSHDGSKLAVGHTTAPYLRVYDTSTWTYTDAATSAASVRYCVKWSPDDTVLFALGNANPHFCVYNPNLSTRHVGLNDFSHGVSQGSHAVDHATLPKACYFSCGQNDGNAVNKIHLYNYATTSFTNIRGTGVSEPFKGIAVDADNNILWAFGGPGNGITIRRFDLTSNTEITGKDSQFKKINNTSAALQYTSIALLRRSNGTISGSVRDITNTPVAREVNAFDRASGILYARTMSDAVTGDYVLNLPYSTGEVDVQFKIETGELLNDLFFARAVPAAV